MNKKSNIKVNKQGELVEIQTLQTQNMPVYVVKIAGINLRGYISKIDADNTANFMKNAIDKSLFTGLGVEIEKLDSGTLHPMYMLKIGGINLRPYLSYPETLRAYQYMTKILRAITGTAPGLVLWNKLGSRSEIENSQVGLGGTFSGAGSFVPGMFGNAYSVNYDEINEKKVSFPKEVIPIHAGTIEFWAKLTGFPSSIQLGDTPFLICLQSSNGSFAISFNNNNGLGLAGLCGTAGCTFTTGSVPCVNLTYHDILGDGKEDWHHYALIWDENGILVEIGNTKHVAIILDGKLNSGAWYDSPANSEFLPLTEGKLNLVWTNGEWPQGNVTIDNLKIWNYAKTDFSDRFIEWK